jgi:hypothetical protein
MMPSAPAATTETADRGSLYPTGRRAFAVRARRAVTGGAIPLTLYLLVAVAVSLVAASHFVGWPLNATEVEFLLMPSILSNPAGFDGSPYYALAQTLEALSLLSSVVAWLRSAGIEPEQQQIYLRFLQSFFMCAGVAATCFALGGRRRPWLVLAVFFLFIASGKHHLYYFKIVSSTFVSGLVVIAIALALARRMWLAGAVLALVGAVHPAYFLLTACIILLIYAVTDDAPLALPSRHVRALAPLAIFALPIVLLWILNYRAILQPAEDTALWFSYMESRSDLAFPLRQGYAAVLGMLVPLTIAAAAFWREWRATGNRRFRALAALAAFGVMLVVVQILASEVFRLATITRLTLSHRLQFSLDVLIFVAIVWIALRRYAESALFSWLALIWLCIVYFTQGALPNFGLTDRGTLFAAVLALQTIEDAARHPRLLRLALTAFAWSAVFAALIVLSPPAIPVIWPVMWCVAGAFVEHLLRRQWTGVARVGHLLRPVAATVVLVTAAVFALRPINPDDVAADLATFAGRRPPARDAARWQGRNDYAEFIEFVTKTVPPDERIISVPFYLGQSMTPVPYRATYLDWGESNYLLYLSGYLDYVIARLDTYGIKPLERPKGCTIRRMFLAPPDSDDSRCSRIAFQRQSWLAVRQWRANIPQIRALSPTTGWVLTRRNLLCSGEQPAATWKELAIIRLDAIRPEPACPQT